MTRKTKTSELRVSVTEFKAKCLAVFDQLEQRKIKRVIVTRRGTPVAEIGPVKAKVPLPGVKVPPERMSASPVTVRVCALKSKLPV